MGKTKEIREYEEYLKTEELAEGTIQIYVHEAEQILYYLSGRKITKNCVVEYKKSVMAKEYRPSTNNLHIVAVNRYLSYLGHADCKLKTVKLQTRQSIEQLLTIEEYRDLLQYAKESAREKYYLIIRALAMTGIRISELKYITKEALEKKVILVSCKQKIREIYLPENLIRELKKYCLKNEIKSGSIFRGKNEHPISRVAVYKMLVKMADMTGIDKGKVHPHSLRHFFAVTYMEHYANLFELADLLGHSSLETTRIYVRSTSEKKRQRINEMGL